MGWPACLGNIFDVVVENTYRTSFRVKSAGYGVVYPLPGGVAIYAAELLDFVV